MISDKDKEYLKMGTTIVKEFLEEKGWYYSTLEPRSDVVIYEFGVSVDGIKLRMRIHVETDPDVCRIDAILPFSADTTYQYLVCEVLNKENYAKRFGSFRYDEHDGEITYEYSFLTQNGLIKEDLDIYFDAVVGSVVSGFDDIRKCCIGRFKRKKVNEILMKVNALVNDISE